MQPQIKLINSNENWNVKKRYKRNSTVSYFGSIYQNSTGINSDPLLGNDWLVVKKVDIVPSIYYEEFIDSGTHEFIVPEGILVQNAFLNGAQVVAFTQTDDLVTVPTAVTDDLVTLTGRN